MSDQPSLYNTQVLTVRPTQPFPPDTSAPTAYVFCASPNAKMHRSDGMPLDFHRSIHATNNRYSIDYFAAEIANGHPEIRWATPEEVESYLYHKDPAGYTREKTIAEMQAEMDARLAELVTAQLKKHGIETEFTVDDVKNATETQLATGPAPTSPPAETLTGIEALRAKLSASASATSTASLVHAA